MVSSTDTTYFMRRAAEARQASLTATNPAVRAIHRELAWRYSQLAGLPDLPPLGGEIMSEQPRNEVPLGRDRERWEETRTVEAATQSGANWENEGGAPHPRGTAR